MFTKTFYNMIIISFVLFNFQYSLLSGQTKDVKDSVQTATYQFITEKMNTQAKQHNFNINSPFKGFLISSNGKHYRALFPPKKISSDLFKFATGNISDSIIVQSLPLNSLDYIKFRNNRNYQFGLATNYGILAAIPAAIISSTCGHEENDALFMSFLSGLYFLPSLLIGGIFSANTPAQFRYDRQDYFANQRIFNFEVGLFYGYLNLDDNLSSSIGKNTKIKGLWLSFPKKNSHFGYSLKLYQIPLPPLEVYIYQQGKKVFTGDSELLINPSIKMYTRITKHLKINILTGFVSQILFLSEQSAYPYAYNPLWGAVETEIQWCFAAKLALNFNMAYHYGLEGYRTLYDFGISFSN